MRSSAILALAFIATAGPAFAAPVAPAPAYARRQEPTDSSEALSLGSVASIASLVLPFFGDLFNKVDGSSQRRGLDELQELLARAEAEADESGAISLGTLGTIFSIGSSVIGGLIDHFKGDDSSSQQTRRALEELLARQEASTDESGALSLGSIGTIVSIGSSIIGGLIDHFKNNGNAQQRRAVEELLARQDVNSSEALSLGTIISLGTSLLGPLISELTGGSSSRRDLEELLARAETEPSEALSLGSLGTIISLGSSLLGPLISELTGGSSSRRDIEELLARAAVEPSEAIKMPSLGDAASIASIGSSIVGIFHNLFGGDSNSRRELIDLLARAEVDESGALKLPSLSDAAGLASIAGGVVSVFHDIFGGSDNSNAQRALAEILARADTDESGALKLPSLSTLGSIASLGISGLGILGDLFGGDSNSQQQQRRELLELLARADADESGALKLPSLSTLGSIASLGISGLGILGDLFGGSSDNNQQQSRELHELLTRAIASQKQARSLADLD